MPPGGNLGTKLGNFDGERERERKNLQHFTHMNFSLVLLWVLFFSHMNLLLLNLGFEDWDHEEET